MQLSANRSQSQQWCVMSLKEKHLPIAKSVQVSNLDFIKCDWQASEYTNLHVPLDVKLLEEKNSEGISLGFGVLAQMEKNLPAMWETQVRSLGQKDPLEKELATHSRILAWRILWTEEPGGL